MELRAGNEWCSQLKRVINPTENEMSECGMSSIHELASKALKDK